MAKKMYYQSQFSKYKGNMKGTWAIIKGILNRTQPSTNVPEYFNINGHKITDKKVISNEVNSLFTNIGANITANLSMSNSDLFKGYLCQPTDRDFRFAPVSEEDVIKIIHNLKPKSSCGFDKISVKLIKFAKNELCKPITVIVNQCLETGIFPDKLKIAKVIPLFKKGDSEQIDNYRPISILPAISKRQSSFSYNEYFNTNDLLYKSQYGFRPKHSAELAALEIVDKIIYQMDNSETPISVFLDLSKAFDLLDHNILLYKLKYYGIISNSLQLLENYLTNRKQYIEFEKHKSDLKNITIGVPQCSIIGPLFFIIYINNIVLAPTIFTPIIYADDTTLFSTLEDFNMHNGCSIIVRRLRDMIVHFVIKAPKLANL